MVAIDPAVDDRDQLFRLFADRFAVGGWVESPDEVVTRLEERETILSTAIGGGVAVPHAQLVGLRRLLLAVSVHPGGIDYPALDQEPVRLVFCLLGGTTTTADHLAGLARLARLARQPGAVDRLIEATTPAELLARLVRLEEG
jgi:PTS system nitrogen regulatory IIA component